MLRFFPFKAPQAESGSSRCCSISEWVIAAESQYQPHFVLGFFVVRVAVVAQQFVLMTRFLKN